MILDILLMRLAMVNKNPFLIVCGHFIIVINQTGSLVVIEEETFCSTIYC